jgi:hypothetical protein
MSRRVTYFNSSFTSILTPDLIFGADLYDWWDYTDLATQSIAGGGQINTITSKGTNAGVFASSGTSRPASIVGINGLNVADFDGVNDFMEVAASTGMYNFLHDGSLGTVILVNRINDADPNNAQVLINNNNLTTTEIGFSIIYDDRSSLSRSNLINNSITKGVTGQIVSSNITNNDTYLTQQYNFFINKLDADASPAADRSALSINGGSEIKNNVETNAPVLTNATNNLTIGRRASFNDFLLKGQIPEIIILNSHPTPTQLTQLNAYYTNKYGSTFPIV